MGKNLENEEWREEAPKLSGMQEKDVFSVPQNYFEDLSAGISAKISLDNIKSLSDQEAFTVPAGYFDLMKTQLSAKIKSPSQIRQLWMSNMFKYASAACFVIVAGLGVYFNKEHPQQAVNYAEIANEQMLFDIDEDVIIEHLQGTESLNQTVNADQSDLESYILTNFSTSDLTAEY